jgi:D-alanyl-D-alanine carboxypeptidase
VFESRGWEYGRLLLCLVAVVTAIGCFLPSTLAQSDAPAAATVEPLAPPADVTAQAVYVEDATAGVTLYAANSDERRPPASTTKLMTALVIANNTSDWQELVTAEEIDVRDVSDNESMIGLLAGDVFTVEQMMYGLMLNSGNDSASLMARFIGAKLLAAEGASGDPAARFVQEMNATAANLGLQHTHFTNPDGLYDADHYTTAHDLTKIAAHAYAVPQIAQASSVATYEFTSQGANPRVFTLQNTNKMLGQDGVIGGKTGTLMESGACLVVRLDQGGGNMVIGVVLGSDIDFGEDQIQIPETDQRFNDMSTIIGAMTQDFRWVQPGDADFPGLSQELAVWNVRLGDDHALVLPAGNTDALRYLLQLGPPAQPDAPVGTLLFFSGDRVVGERQVLQAGTA